MPRKPRRFSGAWTATSGGVSGNSAVIQPQVDGIRHGANRAQALTLSSADDVDGRVLPKLALDLVAARVRRRHGLGLHLATEPAIVHARNYSCTPSNVGISSKTYCASGALTSTSVRGQRVAVVSIRIRIRSTR